MEQVSSSPLRSVIALLTDFGHRDGYVGVMKGVIAGIAPYAQIIDITHDIAPQHIAEAAWILATSYRYFPAGTIFTCVVDPGVGSARLPIAVHAGAWLFVGPDNGLLSYILREQPLQEVVALDNAAYHRSQVSATFQGRDVFAPVAAHLAQGVALADLGTPLSPEALQRIDLPTPLQQGTRIYAHIIHIDHFGNLVTSIPQTMVPTLFAASAVQLTFSTCTTIVTERRRYFSAGSAEDGNDQPQPFLYVDSSGYLGVAVRNNSAARLLNVTVGAAIALTL